MCSEPLPHFLQNLVAGITAPRSRTQNLALKLSPQLPGQLFITRTQRFHTFVKQFLVTLVGVARQGLYLLYNSHGYPRTLQSALEVHRAQAAKRGGLAPELAPNQEERRRIEWNEAGRRLRIRPTKSDVTARLRTSRHSANRITSPDAIGRAISARHSHRPGPCRPFSGRREWP